jgi:hypothetical protein
MDVLDFLVVLSPSDKFDFTVAQGEGAVRPTMSWNDNTCVVGPGTSGSVQFPPPSPFVSGNETMSVGHLEVLGVADITDAWVKGEAVVEPGSDGAISLAEAAKHGPDGEPANCSILVSWLASPSRVALLNEAAGPDGERALGDVGNVLVGRYVLTGQGLGIEAGGDAIGIRDSDLGPPNGPRMTAQSGAGCVNCKPLYAWDQLEWDHPHLGEMRTLEGFQYALSAPNIAGDWSNNPANDVGVDWVLSFPNKYAYLDYVSADECQGGATTGQEWCLLYETQTGYGLEGVWTSTTGDGILGTADLCLNDNSLTVFDREEQQAASNVNVSPGTRTTLDICQELEVFTLAAEGQAVRESVIQVPGSRRIITFENLDAIRGWARMTVPWATVGDSITGVLFTTRNTDDPTINNGSLTDLQKDVGGPAP